MFREQRPFASCLVLALSISAFETRAEEPELTHDALEALLEDRDRVIQELQHTVNALAGRLDSLERAVGSGSFASLAVPGEPHAPARAPGSETASAAREQASGRLEVDDEAAERALERTLVQEGVLLLPTGIVEVDPSVTYTYNDFDFPTATGETKIERNTFSANLDLRAGLPFDSQVELSLPYRWVDEETETSSGGFPTGETSENGSALGDITVGLAKTLVREDDWWPDVVARAFWDTGSGDKTEGDVALGGGFQSVGGSLSFVKRRDPLAFFGSTGYQAVFENDGVDPGNRITASLGTALAVSPESSLLASIENQFVSETEIDGTEIDGSDLTAVTLNLGVSTILGRDTLLNVTTGIGVTDDAPDYSIGISLPIKTDAFVRWFEGRD